jgi:DNA processing protein
MDDIQELACWVALNQVRGVGPARFRALLDYFGSAQSAWAADEACLTEAGIDSRTLSQLRRARSGADLISPLEKTLATGMCVLTWDDPHYPRYLKEIPDPPPVLYVRGTLTAADEWAVAVVGTRRPSSYGSLTARQLTQDLSRSGATIVSGLARGIDGIAHQAALEAGGRTVGVLGSGLNQLYPPEHRRLAH